MQKQIVSLLILATFLFNTAVSDLAFGQSLNHYASVDKLAPSSGVDDLTGTQHKDIAVIKLVIEAQLIDLIGKGVKQITVDELKTLIEKASKYKDTIFNLPTIEMHPFLHEITSIGTYCRIKCAIKDRTYYAIVRLSKDEEGGFPVEVYTEDEFVNSFMNLAGQREVVIRPYEVTAYIETEALPRIAEGLYSKYLISSQVMKTDFDDLAASERARYGAYLESHQTTIQKIYNTPRDLAERKTKTAIAAFDGAIKRFGQIADIAPQVDERTGAIYFDFSDEDRIFHIYPGNQKEGLTLQQPIVRELRRPKEVIYTPGLRYKKFNAAGLLDRRGDVKIRTRLPNPQAAIRHEVVGHVNTAYLIAANPKLYKKILDSFENLAEPQKEDILREFIRIRVNPFYRNEIPPERLDSFQHPKLSELLSKSKEWGSLERPADGKMVYSVNWVRVVDELIALWAEFGYSLDNIIKDELRPAGRRLYSLVNIWIEGNKPLFARAGYFGQLESILTKDVSGISTIAWCWGRRLSELVGEKNSSDDTDYDSDTAYRDIRKKDEEFSKELIDEIEKEGLGNLDTSDKDSLAGQLSDDIVEDVLFDKIVPEVNRLGFGEIDMDDLTQRAAKQLKDRLYADDGAVSTDDLLKLLKRPGMQEKLRALANEVEKYTVLKPKPKEPQDSLEAKKAGEAEAATKRLATEAAIRRAQGKSRPQEKGRTPPRGGTFSPAPSQPGEGDEKKELPGYLTDLTKKAKDGEVDEVYFRDEEMREIKRVLNRKENPNVMLLGQPGVGKTAIANKLALEISMAEAGYGLNEHRVLSLDAAAFIGASGGTADGFGKLVKELLDLISDGKTVLFVDEIHVFSDSCGIPGVTSNFFTFLKDFLATGKIKVIGVTTKEEFKAYIEKDTAFVERFSQITVQPPSPSDAKDILIALKARYENAQNKNEPDPAKQITISEDACIAAVDVSERVLKTKPLLRKATKALDEAAAAVRTRQDDIEARIKSARKNIVFYCKQLRQARQESKRSRVKELSAKVKRQTRNLLDAQDRMQKGFSYLVTVQDVLEAFVKFGIPLNVVNETEREKVNGLESYLKANLKGQPEAVETIVASVRRQYVNQNRKKPIGAFFFAGPTGTGKTEIARLLAKYLFDSSDPEKDGTLIRVDLSQFAELHRISQLIGAPPGYVGYDTAATLLERVRDKPYSIVLLDEADKCHPDILTKVFLPIMEEGSTRTPKGEVVDFSNTIIIFTSNFGLRPEDYLRPAKELKESLKSAMRRAMPPEFVNRMEEPIVYNMLSKEVVHSIVKDVQLPQLVKRYEIENRITVEFEDIDKIINMIVEKGFNPLEGARGIKRAIADLIDNHLSDMLIEGNIGEGKAVVVRRPQEGDGKSASRFEFEIRKKEKEKGEIRLVGASPGETTILEKIESVISGMAERDITAADLEAMLDIKPANFKGLANFRPREDLPFKAAPEISVKLRKYTPRQIDEALDAAISKEKLEELFTKAGRQLSVDGLSVIERTIRRLVNEAKRQDLDGITRLITKYNRYAELEQGGEDAKIIRRQVLDTANTSRAVSLDIAIEDAKLKAKITYSTYLILKEEERLIDYFGHQIEDEGAVEKAERDERPLAQARYDIISMSGETGYAKQGGQATTLWFTVPIEKISDRPTQPAPAAPPAPAVVPEGTTGPLSITTEIITQEIGKFCSPNDIAIDNDGNIFVPNWGNSTISVLTRDGKELNKKFGIDGIITQETGGFYNSHSAAINKDGNIFVSNWSNSTILVLTPNGKELDRKFGKNGIITQEIGKFDRPYGIDIDSAGNIFVPNANNHTVSVLTPDGKGLNKDFGIDGIITQEIGKFDEPRGVAINKNGNIFVSNWGNSTISVLTRDGKELDKKIGKDGIITKEIGKFDRLPGIAIDNDDNIFVSNINNHTVSVLTPYGKELNKNFGIDGIITQEIGKFDRPQGVTINKYGDIFIPNQGNDTVSVLRLKPAPARPLVGATEKPPKQPAAKGQEPDIDKEEPGQEAPVQSPISGIKKANTPAELLPSEMQTWRFSRRFNRHLGRLTEGQPDAIEKQFKIAQEIAKLIQTLDSFEGRYYYSMVHRRDRDGKPFSRQSSSGFQKRLLQILENNDFDIEITQKLGIANRIAQDIKAQIENNEVYKLSRIGDPYQTMGNICVKVDLLPLIWEAQSIQARGLGFKAIVKGLVFTGTENLDPIWSLQIDIKPAPAAPLAPAGATEKTRPKLNDVDIANLKMLRATIVNGMKGKEFSRSDQFLYVHTRLFTLSVYKNKAPMDSLAKDMTGLHQFINEESQDKIREAIAKLNRTEIEKEILLLAFFTPGEGSGIRLEDTMPTTLASEVGRQIPTPPDKQYNLLLTSEFFANGELEAHRSKYGDRFKVNSVSGRTPEQFIGNILAKAKDIENRTIALVPDNLPAGELERLAKAGVRFIRTNVTALLDARDKKDEYREKFQLDTYATMLVARRINENDIAYNEAGSIDYDKSSAIYKVLNFYISSHFTFGNRPMAVEDYIKAILNNEVAKLIIGYLSYRPAQPYDTSDYNNVAITLISA